MKWSEEERKKRIQILVESCPEFIRAGVFGVLEHFMCPIALTDIDVNETIVEEYSNVELLILRLYFYGIKSAEEIADVTGLDKDMVLKILQTEMITYRHIDDKTGEMTENGLETIYRNEEKSADELIEQTALYKVRRELQVEAVTGMVLKSKMELPKSALLNSKTQVIIPPCDKITIDEIVQKDINSRLMEYESKGYISKNDAIYEITKAITTEIRYRDAFFVKPDYFKYPFIAFECSKNNKYEQRRKLIEPLAISKTDFKCLEIKEKDASYVIRDDTYFDRLTKYVPVFMEIRTKRLEQERKNNSIREGK